MSFNNFLPEDIVERIQLFLPSKFTRDSSSEIYKLLLGLSEILKISSDEVDELFRQTNLYSATGAYVDDFITGQSKIGRKEDEEDETYKTRYKRYVYVYNSTKNGIKQIVIDITGSEPVAMFNGQRRGAYLNDRQYFNDTNLRSTYGDISPQPFTGYIQFAEKPSDEHIDELCKVITKAKASGIKLYLYYPIS